MKEGKTNVDVREYFQHVKMDRQEAKMRALYDVAARNIDRLVPRLCV